jgi:hypothetical protein
MTEFEIDGKSFRISKLSAIQQFHLQRKIAPLIPPLIPVFLRVSRSLAAAADKEKRKNVVIEDMGSIAELAQPFADGLAGMKDADAEYVFSTALSAVQFKSTEKDWAPVWSVSAKAPMFQDFMDMAMMIRLIVRVIMDSLGPFIRGFLTDQLNEPETA